MYPGTHDNDRTAMKMPRPRLVGRLPGKARTAAFGTLDRTHTWREGRGFQDVGGVQAVSGIGPQKLSVAGALEG